MTEKTYANGLTTTYDYNPSNQRLTAMKCPGLQDFGYAYDEVGNILSVADGIAGQTDTFTYDDLDRLKSAGDGGYRASYEYDAVGNMTSETMLADMFDTGRKRGGPVKIHHKADYFYGDNAGPHAVTRKVITQFGNSDTSETPGQSGNTKRYFSASFHSAFSANFTIYDADDLECSNEACNIAGADFELNSDGTRIVSLPISEDGGNSYRFVMSSSKDGTGTLTVRAYEGDVEISSDTQEFEIKANQLFKTSVSASLPSSEQPIRFEPLAPYESPHDFDCNEKVDDADIAKVTSKWNLSCGVPGYDPIYDLDGDCYISILDIMAVVSNSTR
jgi:hypothetical protein